MLSPLSERVDAPHRLELPLHPDVAVWRPLTVDDAPALARLHAAADPVDHPDWVTPEPELRDRLARSDLDLAHDTIAGLTDDGDIAAYGINFLDANPESIVRVVLDGTISPELRGRGLGRRLLQWQRGRAQQQLAASDLALPGWVLTWQPAQSDDAIGLARLLGFRPVRFSTSMTRDLTQPVAPHATDAAFRLVSWDAALSGAALDAYRATFRDHWGTQPATEESWRALTEGEFFRPDLTFVAVATDEPQTVVGYAVTSAFPGDFERQGYSSAYLDLLGTRREHRGHGIASALLARVLEASRAAGFDRAVFDVDTPHPTSPVELYTAQGFVATDHRQVALLLNY
ncbi:MAG: GNAT family N-acetyltransferase [Microbacteriaceae bacterium]|nr:GNAT family N-acetyltransferase [Microbacteriaceae bacterium]MCL2795670.1 GNAT family N-acetyltransferase [Microbacteriaceae bacterium]